MDYPLAHRNSWYSDGDYKARGGRIVSMPPHEYLNHVRPLTMDDESRENVDILKDHIQSGGHLDPLKIYADGKEDGRHRAHAAQELGIKHVPVMTFNHDKFGGHADYQHHTLNESVLQRVMRQLKEMNHGK